METGPTSNAPDQSSISDDLVVLLQAVEDWANAAQGRVAAVARLVAAETKLALSSLLAMAAFAIVVALFALAGWVFLAMGLYFALTTLFEMAAYQALFILSTLHAVTAYALWRLIRRLSRNVRFTATRAALGKTNDREGATRV